MSDLAERIRDGANAITLSSRMSLRERCAAELGFVVQANAPTILAGLAALEERDKLLATIERLRELVDDALIYDDEQEHEMRKLLNLRTD